MAWRIASGPDETRTGSFDGVQWRFRLEDEQGRAANVTVGVSGTALAVASVPPVTAEAIATRGRTAIERVLEWPEPPTQITFTTEESPAVSGGVPPDESGQDVDVHEQAEVDSIRIWFDERGYELVLHQPGGREGGWFAPFMRHDSDVGSAAYGWGRTRLEAARDAQREFRQREEARSVSA